MDFKERIVTDLDTIFFNLEEFADWHRINEKDIRAIVDDAEKEKRENRVETMDQGLYLRETVMYVKKEEFGAMPAIGCLLFLDGKRYQIKKVLEENGVYNIGLEAYQS